MSITVLYFAAMKETTGCAQQSHACVADAAQLFALLNQKYRFGLSQAQLRVAINGQFAPWHTRLQSGDEVAFIPPVSGG